MSDVHCHSSVLGSALVWLSPVVEQLYWGYWVKATALSTPSSSICSMAFSVSG